MAQFEDFEAWQYELDEAARRRTQEEKYVEGLPSVRVGKWQDIERFQSQAAIGGVASLELARSIQLCASTIEHGQRLPELLKNQPELDARANDVSGMRAYIGMHDGGFSGLVGGYSILADEELVSLRVMELARDASMHAGLDATTGHRSVTPLYVPVLAVCSFMLLSRS